MIIRLKDGSEKEYAQPMSVLDIAKDISEGLARNACAGQVNGETVDLRTVVSEDSDLNILTFNDEEGKLAFRHTASHVLAQAVKRLYPEAKLAIGPAIEDGFYYDFDMAPLTREDLDAIEKEMKKVIKENPPIERYELPREEAIAYMKEKDEPYKVELIEDLPEDATISFYKQGDFTDLCAGPHLMSVKPIKAFKLTASSGAYWRGNENNKMLTRIYGTAYTKKADLEERLKYLEEIKLRDHNRLGREMELFTTVDVIGQGLPLIMPKGVRMIQTLQRWIEDLEDNEWGYIRTKTPLMAKSDLYKISGHWDHYKEGMFVLGDESKDKEVFALRPMTCPFQYQAFLNRGRSYRDLPMRLNETSTLFRNEASGEMHGLIRVRQFTISEGHLMCTPEQLEEEFKGCLELTNYMLTTLGLIEDVSYRFSQWDPDDREKYIGTEEQWNEAQDTMEKILKDLNIYYNVGVGEAAFYGPKLDFHLTDCLGRTWQCGTIQLDFQLPERFELEYIGADGEKHRPIMIHRVVFGSIERFIGILTEHFAGAYPTWLAPVQVKLLPIADRHLDYLYDVKKALEAKGVRCEIDDRSEKMGFKIRAAQLEKVPYMIIAGDKDIENGTISVRSRKDGEQGAMTLDEFVENIMEEIETKAL